MNAATNLRQSDQNEKKEAACEMLSNLRSVLANLESQVANGNVNGQQMQDQLREWEKLQKDALKAVRASASCDRKVFKRRMSGQAALSGLCFA